MEGKTEKAQATLLVLTSDQSHIALSAAVSFVCVCLGGDQSIVQADLARLERIRKEREEAARRREEEKKGWPRLLIVCLLSSAMCSLLASAKEEAKLKAKISGLKINK
jgi:hypothetical protein